MVDSIHYNVNQSKIKYVKNFLNFKVYGKTAQFGKSDL